MKRIDVLPDDALLDIFYFYTKMYPYGGDKADIEAWQSLVHVCRRWRCLVLGSPRRLNLRLLCTPETPAKDTLDVWPAIPLVVKADKALSALSPAGMDNIIAVLGQSNRVCQVDLVIDTSRRSEEVLTAMQVPFPELTDLRLSSHLTPVIPDSFLGGSAPRLRCFTLSGIRYQGLPKLLLSATHLVDLYLFSIPHSGYTSPEGMVALLSVLPSLKTLFLRIHPRPELGRSLPPPNRSILPALGAFRFIGDIEYLEDLVARIDTPQLDTLFMPFFNQIDFDSPQLAQFINRTPKLRALDKAHAEFGDGIASVKLRSRTSESILDNLQIIISCREPELQLSSAQRICNSSLPPLSAVEDLHICHIYRNLVWSDNAIENTLWLRLLRPFIAVKNLYISDEFAPGIAAALQELVGDRITEVLPSLQNIFLGGLEPLGLFQENIEQFVVARQLSGRPIAITVTGTTTPA